MAIILGGKRPVIVALSFISGMFLVYFLSGVLLLKGFDHLFDLIGPRISRWWNEPDSWQFVLQFILGILLLAYAWWQYRLPKSSEQRSSAESISLVGAFTLGATLIVIGIPGAIPYFGAIEQILRADLSPVASMGALIFYNFVFVSPFLVLVLVRIFLPNKSEAVFASLSRLVKRWSKPAILTVFAILGLVLIADAIGWFLGYPLLPDIQI